MEYFSTILVFITVFLLNTAVSESTCGFKACPSTKQNMINVHLVPHSHDDVGWLKTVDQYYYGSQNKIQHAGVQYILDTVVEELLKDSNRRFIQVETFFFSKWYDEQTETVQRLVKKLVAEGRLEFTGGAWSMNDEATVHYQSVIDQFNLGLKYLKDIFGDCGRPTVGWQIDPFGHSREMASVFAQMGYNGEFFARMDYVDKKKRLEDKEMEMVWQSSEYLKSSNIFTGMLYNHYSAPPGFCFDINCEDAPIIDGESYDNNVDKRVSDFIDYVKTMSKSYRSTHIMVPMGDDFQYEDAAVNFKNMDKLIKYVNDRQSFGSQVNVFYSTPSCYLYELHQLQQTWPNKTEDFFPYSSDSHSYWTGYFTSRPTQKRFHRDGNHFFQTVKQLSVLANLTSSQHSEDLENLSQAMGIMQHHDAVTGTEKQAVARDYDRMLYKAITGAENNARDALRSLTNLTSGEFQTCLELNISVCAITQSTANNVIVTLMNPLAHTSTQYVRVPAMNENYIVTDEKGREVPSEVIPVPWEVLALEHRSNGTQHELVFKASVEKIANFLIRVLPSPKIAEENVYFPVEKAQDETEELTMENSLVKITFDTTTGGLKTIQMNGLTENVQQSFGIYKGYRGNNGESNNRSSGAYIFRPDGEIQVLDDKIQLSFYNGTRVKEVHQHVNEWISQVVRIYDEENRVEFEWMVGPIPADDEVGKEIITRFTSNIASKGKYYTDSNGREMLERERNQREHFNPDMSESISGNYYPVTGQISLQDDEKRITLLNDRAQGGTSLKDGELELMLHRRLLNDDAFGVGEALNETQYGIGLIARGKISLILTEAFEKPNHAERLLQHKLDQHFWKFFSKSNAVASVNKHLIPDFTDLPQSIELLSFEPYTKDQILIRVENMKTEGNVVSFNIYPLFESLSGDQIWETTLDGNMQLSTVKRYKFNQDSTGSIPSSIEYYYAPHNPLAANSTMDASEFVVTLVPMQIRTFIIQQK
ncbi:LOW QUALITY PROTEIN: lysosomal alpha-mannosidase [Drosophila eugracilis]|uniref:LOW QUALITY PROTEIN: lysosomal alpha-mannosidase n=1 Tax=Drosophila eugracilis TaxID=29029 RepID=UPI001BDACBBE|nr:LOW QUALITY PROTEIN: lysosomal alpha-mannosidase [Drosophila eugracilis]